MRFSKGFVISLPVLIFTLGLFTFTAVAYTPGVSHPASEIIGDPSAITQDATFGSSSNSLFYKFPDYLEAGGQITAGTKFYVGGAELTSTGVGQTGSASFSIKTADIDRLIVDGLSGYIGIGDPLPATPSQLLHLKLDIREGPMIRLDRTANTNVDDVAIMGVSYYTSSECPGITSPWSDHDSFWIGRGTANPDKKFTLRLNSGNVGLGTVCPNYQLSLADTSGNQAGLHMSPIYPAGLSGFLAFYGDGRTISTATDPNIAIAPESYSSCPGCVAVNKTDPTTQLDVKGTVTAVGFLGDGSGISNPPCVSACAQPLAGLTNVGTLTLGADTDSDNIGEIAFQTKGNTRMMIKNDGRTGLVPDVTRPFNNPTRTLCIGDEETCIDNGLDTAAGSVWPDDLLLETLAFFTSDTERMRITGTGLVGVGTDTPNAGARMTINALTTGIQGGLHVVGGVADITTVDGQAIAFGHVSSDGSSWTHRMRIHSNGNVGIGTASPTSTLDVVGTIYASGDIISGTQFRAGNSFLATDSGQVAGDLQLDGDVTFTKNYGILDLNNTQVLDAHNYNIDDPGPGEGLSWDGTGWVIDVTPEDRSNAAGNLNLYGTSNYIVAWRPLKLRSAASRPACTDSTNRGLLWFSQGAWDYKDSLAICAKSAANSYAWRTIY